MNDESKRVPITSVVDDELLCQFGPDAFTQLQPIVRGMLRNWLTDRQTIDCVTKDDAALFVTKYRKRLGTEFIRYLLSELSQRAGIDASPHSLRHAFGKNLVDAGESLDRVGELLGHRSLDTTRIYTAPTEADLARAVARLEN